MKFLIITCIKEQQNEAFNILRKANVDVLSTNEIIGYKTNQQVNHLDEWFASGYELTDSQFIFSFTSNENAECALQLIKVFNEMHVPEFPLRAFIVAVEKSSF